MVSRNATIAYSGRRWLGRLDRVDAVLPSTDLNRVFDVHHEDLAIASLAGVGGLGEGVDHVLGGDLGDSALDFDLLMEVDRILLAAPATFLGGLTPSTRNVGDGEGCRTDFGESLLCGPQFFGANDGSNHLDTAVVRLPTIGSELCVVLFAFHSIFCVFVHTATNEVVNYSSYRLDFC